MDFISAFDKNNLTPGLYGYPERQSMGEQYWPGRFDDPELELQSFMDQELPGLQYATPIAGMFGFSDFKRVPYNRAIDSNRLGRLKNWLFGSGAVPEEPQRIYRGIPLGIEPEIKEPYTHATPWIDVAARAGKGAFGDPRSNYIISYPTGKDRLYYRGGSLAGDPFETTKIGSAKGMSWNDLLESAKDVNRYYQRKGYDKLDAPYYTARNFVYGSFETDVKNKPGIWTNYEVPGILSRENPRLRSTDDLVRVLNRGIKFGTPLDELLQLPEARILQNNPRWDEWFQKALRKYK